jgi:hypothetical protein
MPATSPTSALEGALRSTHEAWLRDARRFLGPALDPLADFWTRWAAVRYLSDDFRAHYRMERALVDQLRLLLPKDTGVRLTAEGDQVWRLRLEIDRIGRRRGTALEFAAGAGALLERLGLWLSEIEGALDGLPSPDRAARRTPPVPAEDAQR